MKKEWLYNQMNLKKVINKMKQTINDIPKIIVSCQSRPGQPFYNDKRTLKKVIDSVILGGAKGVRINGEELIKYTKKHYPNVFILGTKKIISDNSPTFGWITPDIKSIDLLLKEKPQSIILDASEKLHTKKSLSKLIKHIKKHSNETLIGCDIGNIKEAEQAIYSGADFVLTTHVQSETRQNKNQKEHLALLKKLHLKKIPTIAEGGIVTETDLQKIISTGIYSVVIGKAITDPVFNTRKFINEYNKHKKQKLVDLYIKIFKYKPKQFTQLTPHGSNREYFLISNNKIKVIGTIGEDKKENVTFIKMSKHLIKQKVSVPKVIAYSKNYDYYIQEFCGNKDLFSYIKKENRKKHTKILYPAIDLLHDFQTKGTKGWNYKNSYPFEKFDTHEIHRDSKRFISRFLKHIPIKYSFKKFSRDIDAIIKEIEQIPEEQYVLMHRDFQSRNILVHNKKYILIDFQSARKGPLHYDMASLLYQSQINYDEDTKTKLLEYFISKNTNIDRNMFMRHFYHIVIIRLIQSLGSYGIAGIEQQKTYFIKSIPFALKNMQNVLKILKENYKSEMTELENITNKLIKHYDTHI